ncbi:32 kDa-cell wall symbiosis regulated acidic polypeptide [Pisolithus marmoratus]|nr:32 kDa-cell wall symbiosis regulated acidic polypeptide [Pisolithus marmoratus]
MSDEITSLLAYVESATLAPIEPGLHTRPAFFEVATSPMALAGIYDRGKFLDEPGKDGAAAVCGTLVSVLANLSEQNRTDVANSLEFASRVAMREVGSGDYTPAYWKEVKKVLFHIGWSKQRDECSKDVIDGQTAGSENFSDYAIENVRNDPLYSDAEKSVVIRSMESLRSHAEKRAFFIGFTAGGRKGSFAVSVATTNNGALTMRLSAFTFNCNAAVDDYLISSIKNIRADVGKDDVVVTGDQKIIDSLRSKIEEKLGDSARDYIISVEI